MWSRRGEDWNLVQSASVEPGRRASVFTAVSRFEEFRLSVREVVCVSFQAPHHLLWCISMLGVVLIVDWSLLNPKMALSSSL